ncbi:MAG TPA: response regulator transcription factor [Thermomicrobiaceae bacterium]|nr:response regulator transcription factor [Thermomicrobiaceae bacterium]
MAQQQIDHYPNAAPARPGRQPISVVLVDDHVLFRQALRHLLESEPDIRIVGEAGTGDAALGLAEQKHPDVVLMDISMPGMDGVAATRDLKAEDPAVKVIILTMFGEDGHVIRAVRAGADAYLLKNTEATKLVDAIRAAARGASVIEPRMAATLLSEFRRMSSMQDDDGLASLTEREIELLRLVAQGLSNKEIAYKLKLAESTIKNRLSILFEKLDVKDRTQAAIYALSHGLVTRRE